MVVVDVFVVVDVACRGRERSERVWWWAGRSRREGRLKITPATTARTPTATTTATTFCGYRGIAGAWVGLIFQCTHATRGDRTSMILSKLSRLGAFLLGVFAALAAVGIVFGVWNYQQNNRSWPREWAENRFRALKPYLKENAVAAELGVLKGDFSHPILQSLKPAKLHLVDPWYLLGPEWAWEKGWQWLRRSPLVLHPAAGSGWESRWA